VSEDKNIPEVEENKNPDIDLLNNQSDRDSQNPNNTMGFFEHLGELRRRLIISLLSVVVGSIICWQFVDQILHFILNPILPFLPAKQGLIYTGLPDAFAVSFKVSVWAGVLLVSPICLYQIWAFVAPGLSPQEKSKVPILTVLASFLLLAGASFAYFIAFPMTFNFFLNFSTDILQPLIAIDRYLSLAMGLMAGFSLAFQLPLILMFLGKLNIISSAFLKKYRHYAVIIIFILAAILTPPDVISQILLALILIFLYELSIFLMSNQTKKDKNTAINDSSDSDKN